METELSFRVYGDDLDPEKISGFLDAEPEHAHRKGEKRPNPKYGPYSGGLWRYTTSPQRSATLEQHLDWMLDWLEARRGEIAELRSQGFRVDLFAGLFFTGGSPPAIVLRPEQMQRIGGLGLALDLNIYIDDEV
jgi:hypothetical protein